MLVRNDNYYVVQGWMVNELGLKGNDLLIYAIIYGFSQTEEQRFTGSRKYLAEWTGSTKRTVQNSLNSLIEKGLIIKHENMVNGVKFCEYSISQVVKKVHWGGENFSLGGGEKSSPNNIDIDNIDNNIDISIKKNIKKKDSDIDYTNKEQNSQVAEIVIYLNQTAWTNYKLHTPKTQRLIRARLNEGFTVDDFKAVIDKKCDEWLYTDMAKYLRPETLFGTKFEGYLNQKNNKNEDLFSQVLKGETVIYDENGNDINSENAESSLSNLFPKYF